MDNQRQAELALEQLMKNISLTESEKHSLEHEVKKNMGLDDLNLEYFKILYRKFKNPKKGDKPLKIIEKENDKADSSWAWAYPTATAPENVMKNFPVCHYSDLKKKGLTGEAKKSILWVKKMQAGSGSSLTRETYLQEMTGKKEVRIGAKGTDLYGKVKGKNVTLAELQILQSLADVQEGYYAGVILHDIVSSETEESIKNIWEKICPLTGKTYKQMIGETKGMGHSGRTFQSFIPTVDEQGNFTSRRKAPGGHALFGVDALRVATKDELRPTIPESLTLVGVVGNGEDLSSSPDPLMVEWMIKEKIPAAMVTTSKTSIDLKGGQMAIVPLEGNQFYVSMIEKAQADSAGQGKLFESLGLREGDREAFFNTNMVLVNYSVLVPKIKKLIQEVGEQQFFDIVAPDLILNVKKQKEDGVERKYTQLEGAMGTVFLNLDRYWRERYKEGLLHILNVEAQERTRFFSPIKTAFDYVMQFHSDRFYLDEKLCRMVNRRPGKLPFVSLKDDFYKDVKNTLQSFQGSKIQNLDNLELEGIAFFEGVTLSGQVEIRIPNGLKIVLKDKLKNLNVENQKMIFTAQGELESLVAL